MNEARKTLAEALGIGPGDIPDDASMATLAKWDSLAHMRLIMAVEAKIGHEIDPMTLVEIASLDDIAAVLGGAPARTES